MQIIRLIATAAFFVAIGIGVTVNGQIMGRPGQIANQPLGGSSHTSNPDTAIFNPGNLDYDMQAFAPLDISEFDGEQPVRGGFFARYSRTFLSISRPNPFGNVNLNSFPNGSDFQSGNLYSLGYMSDDGAGWDASFGRTNGIFFSRGGSEQIEFPMMTETTVNSFSLNRTFRQPLSRGGFIEPYFGVRYTYMNDKTIQDDSEALVNDQGTPDPTDDTIVVGVDRFQQNAINSIVGGGVGFRIYQQHGRWQWRTDVGLSGGYNTQTYNESDELFDTTTSTLLGVIERNRSDTYFTPQIDAGALLTYQITRDISVHAGAQITYYWSGLNRANTLEADLNPHSFSGPAGSVAIDQQAATVAGFNLGVEWRR